MIVFGRAFVEEIAGKACNKNTMQAVSALIFHEESFQRAFLPKFEEDATKKLRGIIEYVSR